MHHFPTVFPCAGTDIHNPVRCAHGVFVVLYHDQGITQVAQALQSIDQSRIVALVQTNRGLVQHVEHPHQPRTDLGGQANALGLSSRQSAGGARQCQIVQTHVQQERQACIYLGQDGGRNGGFHAAPVLADAAQEIPGGVHREITERRDVLVSDSYRQNLGFQTCAITGRAGNLAHIGFVFSLHQVRIRFVVFALDVLGRAFETGGVEPFAPPTVTVAHPYFVVRSPHQGFANFRIEVAPRGVDVEVQFVAQTPQDAFHGVRRGCPRGHRTLTQSQRRVGNHQFRVDFKARTQAGAFGAGPIGSVEGKSARLDFFQRQMVVVGAGAFFRETPGMFGVVFVEVDENYLDEAVGQFQCGFYGVGDAAALAFLQHHAVHPHRDVMFEFLVQGGWFFQTM